jgi:hypothetical protein
VDEPVVLEPTPTGPNPVYREEEDASNFIQPSHDPTPMECETDPFRTNTRKQRLSEIFGANYSKRAVAIRSTTLFVILDVIERKPKLALNERATTILYNIGSKLHADLPFVPYVKYVTSIVH